MHDKTRPVHRVVLSIGLALALTLAVILVVTALSPRSRAQVLAVSAPTDRGDSNISSVDPLAPDASLIQNPGNEDLLVSGEIPHWQEVTGTNWTQRFTDPVPFEGSAYFFAGAVPAAELRQDVDVSAYSATIDTGSQRFLFSGYVRSYNQASPDTSRIVLEYLDAAKTILLTGFDSGEIASRFAWQRVTNTRLAPPGTRYIRVRLISTRYGGTNNDGYFDALALYASASELHVCPSGCAFSSIQTAVDVVNAGGVVKVASGVYTGVSARRVPAGYSYPPASGLITQVVYISKTVTIQGGYTTAFTEPPDPDANPTTLDAEGQGRVLCIIGPPSGPGQPISPTIEGLRITGGYGMGGDELGNAGGGVYAITATATIRESHVFSNGASYGAGLYLRGSSAVLNGNVINDNYAVGVESGGGGVYLYDSPATLSANTVSGNWAWSSTTLAGSTAGGGVYLRDSPATLSNNTISGNTAGGLGGKKAGGLYLSNSPATLSDNVISGNTTEGSGGGLYLSFSPAVLGDNIISGNIADGNCGGLYLDYSDARLINNVIADNQANFVGSGLYIQASFPRLLHTTVVRNNGGEGSGIHVTSHQSLHSTVVLTNTILVSQTVGITATAGNTATLNGVLWYANVANTGGVGTITVTKAYTGDPAFAADGYHLTDGSTAIDRGVDAGSVIDIDLDLRPINRGFDIGADEFPLVGTVTPWISMTLVYTRLQGNPATIRALADEATVTTTTLEIPAGAVATTTTIAYTPKDPRAKPAPPSGLISGGHPFNLDTYQKGVLIPDFTFEKTVTLTIEYSDADVAHINEPTLALYRWMEEGAGLWEPIGVRPGESQVLDADKNELTAYLMGLSRFHDAGERAERWVFLPVVLRGD